MTAAPVPEGFRILDLPRVGSTNDVARERAEAGEPAGFVVIAAEQTGGRGRHGRVWQSPPGNLYTSLLLRPPLPLAMAASLSLLASLALLEAIEREAGRRLDLRLKWPNDLLLGGAKLSGLLLEGAAATDGRALWVVIGMGVNLAWHPARPDYPSTALVEHGLEIAPRRMLDAWLAALAAWLPAWEREGFAACRDAWLARTYGIGQPVRLRAGNTQIEGRLDGVEADGSALLRLADGGRRRFSTGELFFGDPASTLARAAPKL